MRPLYKIAEDAARSQTFIPGPTFRTEFPVTRLDYIFTMNGLKTVNYSRLKVNVSDHLPIYGEFLLIRRNTGDENSGRE
jgi:endonuclease/exonuclease/phosphatase (EEP) superfamily protein YafD